MKHLDVKQIDEIIPHRHPFLLVDYIEVMSRVNLLSDINV